MNPLLIVAAVAAATAPRWWPAVQGWAQSEGDPADAIARAIVVEVGAKGSRAERAGIAYVAINRARKWGAPVQAVIRSEVPGRAVWGSRPAAYNARLAAVDPSGAAYKAALASAQGALSGSEPNPIGPRLAFVHPAFRSYGTPGGSRVEVVVPGLGRRWLPSWAVSRSVPGGAAAFEPIDLGPTPTRFA